VDIHPAAVGIEVDVVGGGPAGSGDEVLDVQNGPGCRLRLGDGHHLDLAVGERPQVVPLDLALHLLKLFDQHAALFGELPQFRPAGRLALVDELEYLVPDLHQHRRGGLAHPLGFLHRRLGRDALEEGKLLAGDPHFPVQNGDLIGELLQLVDELLDLLDGEALPLHRRGLDPQHPGSPALHPDGVHHHRPGEIGKPQLHDARLQVHIRPAAHPRPVGEDGHVQNRRFDHRGLVGQPRPGGHVRDRGGQEHH
jgi:hypothetical protein